MSYVIFIAYSEEDEQYASYIHSCLERVVEFKPYKSENHLAPDLSFKERTKAMLRNSFCMVALLTENGLISQWVNQELGYAFGAQFANEIIDKKKRPFIIPVSNQAAAQKLRGFITKDSEDILFTDNYPNYDLVIADIILYIRNCIPGGLEGGKLNIRFECQHCHKESGVPFKYTLKIPSSTEIADALANGKSVMNSPCPQCKNMNSVSLITFLPYIPQNVLKE